MCCCHRLLWKRGYGFYYSFKVHLTLKSKNLKSIAFYINSRRLKNPMYSLKKSGVLEAIIDDHYLNRYNGTDNYPDYDIDIAHVRPNNQI